MSENNKQIERASEEQRTPGDVHEAIVFRDVAPALEFCCWTVVALAPILRWVNGPAVTTDQFVVQVSLVSVALVAAVGLRIVNWRGSKRAS
jgi:hypothetical protein